MSDDADNTAQDSAQDSSGEKTFTQAQLDKILSNRLPEFENYKAKAEQLDSLTATTQSAQEAEATWKQKAEAAESEVAWMQIVLARNEIAAEKGLDPRMWSRIKGESKEEIEADIGELQGFTVSRRASSASLKSGASADGQTTAKERAAQALRGIRER